MESTPGEVNGNAEDVTGRKKSRFKFLKARLFWRLKKKETEGRMKPSQSTGDVTAQEGGRGENDSEDDCHYEEATLSSRALSHDSIFLADQVQSSQPTRVLSQENVHSKIKALQLKLQQQNMRLAPPMLIPGGRMEDPGATSEDDGLPHSPPEISFQEVAIQREASKYPVVKNHLSLLSLAGTGSEEDEQGGFSQPSSRPLSPITHLLSAESLSVGVDFTRPAQYVPILDNSAARHRMSIKPRNQRASTKGQKTPGLYRPRSSSMNSLDQPLTEKEDAQESVTSTHRYLYITEDSTQAKEPVSPLSRAHLQQGSEKVTPLGGSTATSLKSSDKDTEPFQLEDTTLSVSSDGITALTHTRELLAKEPSNDKQYTNMINVNEEQQASTSLMPLSVCPLDIRSDHNVIKENTCYSLAVSSTDLIEPLKTAIGVDVSKPAEITTRPNPVPAPRTKKSNLTMSSPKVSRAKPNEAEKETAFSGLAESPRNDDKPLRLGSFRFNIASAKYRSKTGDENVAKQDEESSGITHKGQETYNLSPVVQTEKAESTKSSEICRNTPSALEKRSTLWRDVIGQSACKTGGIDNSEKSDGCPQNAEHVKSEEGEEDRRGLFGVKLRSTSLSLRYRSELQESEAEAKRHSLESNHILAAKEPVFGDMEGGGNDRRTNVLAQLAPQSLDSQQDPTLDKGSESDSRPEPAWRAFAREKSRALQPFSTKPSTPPNSASLPTPQSSATPQPLLKPSLQPRPHSKNQPGNQSPQQTLPKSTPRAMERWTMCNQREEKSSVSQSSHKDELLDHKQGQSKLGAKSNTQTEPDPQPPSDSAQPTWMELAKRKSLAWSDKTLDSMNF